MEEIVYHDIYKTFGEVEALRGLSLNIKEGDIYGLLGHNGAGKTTALRILLGLVMPTSGQVSVFGMDSEKKALEVRKMCGVLSEDVGLYEELTVFDNLEFYARLYDVEESKYKIRIDELLKYFGVFERKKDLVKNLSLGNKKKVAIIRTILHEPKIVLLDEPTNGLDPVSTDRLRNLIVSMKTKHNTTFILTTHNLHEVVKTCNKFSILKKGKCVTTQRVEDVNSDDEKLFELYLNVEEEYNGSSISN